MKVTYNWLKDFVEIRIAPKALADKLTMAGLEVASLEEKDGDFVFEIEVTSNRPDWLSVIGIAREIATITGSKMKLGKREAGSGKWAITQPATRNPQPLSISIENKTDCPLYTVRIIQDVRVSQSPEWLKKRLELIGCRGVNNIVDITNYILFSLGQPLHAFDLDKLQRTEIIVRRAKAGEKIITIDGLERNLNPEILVIADSQRPVALAGIMGGKETEVTASTKNVLLEAAIFNPVVVRRTRQKLSIPSDSAYRFERGIDIEALDCAAWAAAHLIHELAGGNCILKKSSGNPKSKKTKLVLNIPSVCNVLGINITRKKAKNILSSLGFKAKPTTKDNLSVEAPSFRPDIKLEADLAEEIARIFGYENIPNILPRIKPQIPVFGLREKVNFIKNTLTGLGLNEVITYSLIDRGLLKGFEQGVASIEILNPLSKEQAILRPSLIPSLAKCISYNLNQKQDEINIFEIAKGFSDSGAPQPAEKIVLGIGLCGMKPLFEELLQLKGILEILFSRLGIKDYDFTATDTAEAKIQVNQEKIGRLISLRKDLLQSLDIKNKDVVAAELDLNKLLSLADFTKKFVGLPLYPAISRDISIILKEEAEAKDILRAIKEKAGALLKEVKITDYYKGKQIPAGFKGLTVSCLYRLDERTLTDDEANSAHVAVCAALTERFGAKIR